MAHEFDLAALRDAVALGRIRWQLHALERMLERSISREEVVGRRYLEGTGDRAVPYGQAASKLPLVAHGRATPPRCRGRRCRSGHRLRDHRLPAGSGAFRGGLQDAKEDRDYPLVSGVNLFFAAGVIGFNLFIDLIYPYLDPRVRYK